MRPLLLIPMLALLAACDPTLIVGHALETGFLLAQPGTSQVRPAPPGVVTRPEPVR